MLLPIGVVEIADAHSIGGRGMGEQIVLEIDTHVRHLTLTVGKE